MTRRTQPIVPWITLQGLAAHTGLSVNALREYIKKGMLEEHYHWVKGPNGRLMVHTERFAEWICGHVA